MNEFEAVFGVKESRIKKICVLTPYLTKGLIRNFDATPSHKGRLCSIASAPHFSLICTGIGSRAIGDAVLYLEKTPCQYILFLGSCGAFRKTAALDIGSLVIPRESFSFESFSQVLLKDFSSYTMSYPDEELLRLSQTKKYFRDFRTVTGATFGSLKLEAENIHFLTGIGVDIIDLECSALYHAAHFIQKKAAAFLYVTDIIGQKPFYSPLAKSESQLISLAERTVIQGIRKLCSDLNNREEK
ncbi:MAG: hypothetical protein WC552_00555 [Candidatus Omnitrophota bacterium]